MTRQSTTTTTTTTDNNNGQCVDLNLSAVPETMLWTLHNRVSVANDQDKEWFNDDKAVDIYTAIDYDYERSFGKADDRHGVRSWIFDNGIRDFWKNNPRGGTVVNFAEGLETQRFRIEDARPKGSLMISIDLPSAIQAREKFIEPDEHNIHVAASVLDTEKWMHLVPKDQPVFFTAQGLMMYLEENDIRILFQKLAKEFPDANIWFDSVAKWLSNLTLSPTGLKLTKDYTAPKMPFGANINKAPALFQSWVPNMEIEEIPWSLEKMDGFFFQYVAPWIKRTPLLKNYQPGMVWNIKFPPSAN